LGDRKEGHLTHINHFTNPLLEQVEEEDPTGIGTQVQLEK